MTQPVTEAKGPTCLGCQNVQVLGQVGAGRAASTIAAFAALVLVTFTSHGVS